MLTVADPTGVTGPRMDRTAGSTAAGFRIRHPRRRRDAVAVSTRNNGSKSTSEVSYAADIAKDAPADGHPAAGRRGPHPANLKALRRLKNIEGQVRGLQKMVAEEKYCADILTQVSAVRAALKSVGMVVLRRHIETCVSDAIQAGGEERTRIIDELMSILSKEKI